MTGPKVEDTDTDLDMLTDAERAGMEEDGAEGEEDGDPAEGEEIPEEPETPPAEPEAPAAEPADDAAPAADEPAAAQEPAEEPDDSPVIAPLAQRVDVQAVNARLEEINAAKAALAAQMDEGSLTGAEFTAKLDELNDERASLSTQVQQQQQHDKAVETAWYGDVDKFLARHPDLKANDTRLQSFDLVVKAVTSDPANHGLSNRKQLDLAYARWKADMGIEDKPAAPEPKADAPAPKPRRAKPEIPPTLAHLPAADAASMDDGKFSHLDSLLNKGDHLAFEDALARLSDADRNDYMSRA